MLDSVKDKMILPLCYAAAILCIAVVCMFLFFDVSPVWLRFLPGILAFAGIAGGFALSFIPVFKGNKIIPIACSAVLAVITGIVIVIVI